jgi:hypothetical protein
MRIRFENVRYLYSSPGSGYGVVQIKVKNSNHIKKSSGFSVYSVL